MPRASAVPAPPCGARMTSARSIEASRPPSKMVIAGARSTFVPPRALPSLRVAVRACWDCRPAGRNSQLMDGGRPPELQQPALAEHALGDRADVGGAVDDRGAGGVQRFLLRLRGAGGADDYRAGVAHAAAGRRRGPRGGGDPRLPGPPAAGLPRPLPP